jgi:hypothetical protein
MRTTVLAVLVAVAAAMASQPAEAHGRSRVTVGVGVGFGYPYWGWGPWSPWWYPPPYYYPPATVVVRPAEPVTYIEQGTDTSSWWYYCDASRGYYPYVKECPTGWQRVSPVPTK